MKKTITITSIRATDTFYWIDPYWKHLVHHNVQLPSQTFVLTSLQLVA